MTTLRQAAQAALYAMRLFEDGTNGLYEGEFTEEIKALDAALAKPIPDPVAWMCPEDPDCASAFVWESGCCANCGQELVPVYAPSIKRDKP